MRQGSRDAAGRVLLLASCALVMACGEKDETADGFRGIADELVLESEHFRLHAHEGDPDACDSALGELERHRQVIATFLGLKAPDARLDYYKFASVEELQDAHACSIDESPACVHAGQIRTAKLFDAHELIHAYVEPSRPPWIFMEGLADVLSCGYGPWSRPRDYANFDDVSALGWRELAQWIPSGGALDLTYYRAGAQLLRYLFDTFGVPAVMAHYHAARTTSVPDEVADDFAAHFDQSLAEAWEAALALELPGGPCLTPFECAHPQLEVGESWQVEARCGVGYEKKTFELAAETGVVLSAPGVQDTLGERDSLDMLLSCDGLTATPTWTSFYPARLATRLAAGRYALVLPRPRPSSLVQLTALATTPTCEAALEQPLTLDDQETIIALRPSETRAHIALSAEAPLTVERQTPGTELPIQLCRGCASSSECTELKTSSEPLDPVDTPLLRIDPASSTSTFTLLGVRIAE